MFNLSILIKSIIVGVITLLLSSSSFHDQHRRTTQTRRASCATVRILRRSQTRSIAHASQPRPSSTISSRQATTHNQGTLLDHSSLLAHCRQCSGATLTTHIARTERNCSTRRHSKPLAPRRSIALKELRATRDFAQPIDVVSSSLHHYSAMCRRTMQHDAARRHRAPRAQPVRDNSAT